MVYVLGVEINTASFAMYTFSISVLIQALLVVSVSCAADHGNYRKRLLLVFAFTGAIATMLFLPVVPQVYLIGALFAIIANTCFGASFVLLNSFLPLIVRHHPKTQLGDPSYTPELPINTPAEESQEYAAETDRRIDETSALLSNIPSPKPLSQQRKDSTSIELRLSTQFSSTGIGIGYSAALFVQCLCVIIILFIKNTTLALRVVLFVIGLWWLIFTVPAAMWLRPRPGPPLRTSRNEPLSGIAYVSHAWKSLWRTVTLARRLKDITLFLLAWFLLSDAIATVSGTAVLYAKTQLYMKPEALGLINVIATVAGVLGAFSWSAISRMLNLKPTHTILACIVLFELIPLYGLSGYLPFIQRLGVFGLQQPWEMYPLGFVYGFVLGGLSSYCRSLFGELIPPGSEAAFYALYAITDKGSSVFGPAIVGLITDKTGEIGPAFWFLALLVGLPAPLIWAVDVERGRQEGGKLAEVIEGFRIQRESESASDSGEASVRGVPEGEVGEHADAPPAYSR